MREGNVNMEKIILLFPDHEIPCDTTGNEKKMLTFNEVKTSAAFW